jgi:hypothetical protein
MVSRYVSDKHGFSGRATLSRGGLPDIASLLWAAPGRPFHASLED